MTDENTVPSKHGDETVEELTPSRALTDEERYYHEQSYKAPVESLSRMEDTAKFFIGATATTSGLFASALKVASDFKLTLNNPYVAGLAWFLPFGLWAMSIIAFVCVLLPHNYATGRNEPSSWRAAFEEAGRRKFRRLTIGAALFILGILSAIRPSGW